MPQFPAFQPGQLLSLGKHDGIRYPVGCIGKNGGPYDFGWYAQGYFEAASRLLRDIHRDRVSLDQLVYPLCFLYRQGIELSIKYLLNNIPGLFGETCPPDLNHNLWDNWERLRAYLVQQRQDYPGEQRIAEGTLSWIDAVLKDFVTVDPNSFVFRYPEAKDGTRYLQDLPHVNFTQLGKFMEPLANWFQELIVITGQMVSDAG